MDGLIVEVYRSGWEFVTSDIPQFILDFWQSPPSPTRLKKGSLKWFLKNQTNSALLTGNP